MSGPRRLRRCGDPPPRTRTRDFLVHNRDGTVSQVMLHDRQCTDRIVMRTRLEVRGISIADVKRLTVGELEAIASALRELAQGYDDLSRVRAAPPAETSKPPGKR